MAKFINLKKEAIGLSPDGIVFRGKQKSEYTKLRIIDYNEKEFIEMI